MAATTQNDTKVVTGRVRLSYVHVFEPFANQPNQDAKYSCVLMIPKKDKATIKKIKAAQAAAAEAGKVSKFGGKIPKNLKTTMHDGDVDADLDRNPEYAGHYYMSVSSKTKPGIVDRDKEIITDSSEVYSGCYARASINAFAFNTQGNRGVSFGLNHLQKLDDGDYLGGRSRAEDDFDDLDDDDLDDDDDESLI